MTIQEIVRAATAEHMSYGEYVLKYNPMGEFKSVPKPKRVCVRCGADISSRRPPAKYCLECASERMFHETDS